MKQPITNAIDIANVGPLTHLTIPVPKDGGVAVLKGKNGIGKTTALEAVDTLISKRGELQTKDGAASSMVSGFGATLKLARRMSRTGELEVSSLEGKFSIADLVDPQIKDPDAADAKRIKALIQLANVSLKDPSAFYEIAGGREEFELYVSKDSVATDDLLTMAARIKADFEKAARRVEDESLQTNQRVGSHFTAAMNVDIEQPDDEAVLFATLETSIREESRLRAEFKAYADAAKRTEEAQAALDASQSAEQLSISASQIALDLAHADVVRCDSDVTQLEEQLRTAKAKLSDAEHAKELATRTLREAEAQVNNFATLQQLVSTPLPDKVQQTDIDLAVEAVATARTAVDTGTLVRQAKEHIAKAQELKKTVLALDLKASRLRGSAASTDDVLSQAVQRLGCPLRVSKGRLVTDSDRGEEAFADLSRGEKYKLAIQIAVQVVGRGGVIVIPQEAWEGLDPDNRLLIAKEVTGTGVVILTAECSSDEELTVEAFAPEAA